MHFFKQKLRFGKTLSRIISATFVCWNPSRNHPMICVCVFRAFFNCAVFCFKKYSINYLHILDWIPTMGSRTHFVPKQQKILTSAITKWWFSTPRGLRKMTTWYCYKMKVGFYHEVTWRGNSTTTKWRLVFIIKLLEADTPPLQNENWFLYVFITRLLEGNTSTLQNEDWFLYVFIIKLLEGDTPTTINEEMKMCF